MPKKAAAKENNEQHDCQKNGIRHPRRKAPPILKTACSHEPALSVPDCTRRLTRKKPQLK